MNLRQLRYFYDVAKTENIAKVAEIHMVPASSVSVAIKHLEKELGTPLFDRSANKIKLNEKGKLFAAELGESFHRMESVTQQITERKAASPKIKVLIRARPKWVTELISQFKSENPQTNFIISNDYTITDIDRFDVIIDEDGKQYEGWQRFLLSSEIICVKAASNNPLVGKTLTFHDLKDQVFVLPSVGNGMRNLYERICHREGLSPNVTIECNDRQCLQYLCASKHGPYFGCLSGIEGSHAGQHIPFKCNRFQRNPICICILPGKSPKQHN